MSGGDQRTWDSGNELVSIGVRDKFREECGLMGVWKHREAANLTYLGLYAQQHRGQEGAGVVSLDSGSGAFTVHRGLGLVQDVFGNFDFTALPGDVAIGHVRYTTAGGNKLSNVQPFYGELACGEVAVAHNGNLINADALRAALITQGAIFSATSDTEIILHLLARGPKTVPIIELVIATLQQLRGAYSLLLLLKDRMIAVRDPNGFRPLVLGKVDGAIIAASETCALDLIGAEYLRDIEPGEVVEIFDNGEMRSYFPFPLSRESACIFEYVYFARPDSNIFGRNVYAVRKQMGVELAREHPVQADYVIPVPDSGTTAAIGFAQESKIALELGLIRNHYVGRTFIEPKQSIRDFGVKIKLNPNPELLRDKSIIIVDDSIVRGTTSKKLVKMLRAAGAKEVHMRISSPPTIDPCYYGIDTPSKDELIAAQMSVQKTADYIGVDSLAYLSIEGLYRSVSQANGKSGQGKFCDACFTGQYPIGTPGEQVRRQGALFRRAGMMRESATWGLPASTSSKSRLR
ncbi:MAG: amidophosphoribosyltransferase [Proteobacteria bacterium]|nr:amidophosphoribosyltransferase [Pseudomonadota bacterium]